MTDDCGGVYFVTCAHLIAAVIGSLINKLLSYETGFMHKRAFEGVVRGQAVVYSVNRSPVFHGTGTSLQFPQGSATCLCPEPSGSIPLPPTQYP